MSFITFPNGFNFDAGTNPAAELGTGGIPQALVEASIEAVREALQMAIDIERDENLSVAGRERQLTPIRRRTVKMLATTWANLQVERRAFEAQRVAHYAVPQLAPGDAAGAIRDREIRDWLRGLSDAKTRADILAQIGAGQQPEMAVALMRSPVPLGVEEHVARETWMSTRDALEPEAIKLIDAGIDAVDWAERALGHLAGGAVRGLLSQRTAIADYLAEMDPPRGFEVFGITAMEVKLAEQRQAAKLGLVLTA